jgi:hypothetical protein
MTTEFERGEFETVLAARYHCAMKEQEPQRRKLGSIVVPVLRGNETPRPHRYLRGGIPSPAPLVNLVLHICSSKAGWGRVVHATLPNHSSGVHVRRPTVGDQKQRYGPQQRYYNAP